MSAPVRSKAPVGRVLSTVASCMSVDFNASTTKDAIGGSAEGSVLYATFDQASPQIGSAVSGSRSMTGNLTGVDAVFRY